MACTRPRATRPRWSSFSKRRARAPLRRGVRRQAGFLAIRRGLSVCLVVVRGSSIAKGGRSRFVMSGCGCFGAQCVVDHISWLTTRTSSTPPRYTLCLVYLGVGPLRVPLRCWGSSDRNCLPAAADAQVHWYLAGWTLQPPEARSKPGLGSRMAKSKAICRCLLPFGHREDWAVPYTNRVSVRVISQLLLKSVDAPACQHASLVRNRHRSRGA